MPEIIINYYPPVMKQIKEIQQIAKAEDIEFSKLKLLANEVIQNMFVFTANELGVQRFERILGIKPKAAQSLEDRKIYILSMMNRRKMSLSELTAMLSNYSEGIELINDFSTMEMIVTINTDAGSLETLNNIIDEILPMNIYFEFALQREINFKYKLEDLIFMAFEPAAAETEYCNFDNNITQIEKAGYTHSVTGFSFINPISAAGQMVCGLEYCLAMQAPFELQEGITTIETMGESIITPLRACDAAEVLGEDPPFELQEAAAAVETAGTGSTTPVRMCNDPVLGGDPPFEMQESAVQVQQSQTQAANIPMLCGTDYAREEG